MKRAMKLGAITSNPVTLVDRPGRVRIAADELQVPSDLDVGQPSALGVGVDRGPRNPQQGCGLLGVEQGLAQNLGAGFGHLLAMQK
jgi:hypothetical protein